MAVLDQAPAGLPEAEQAQVATIRVRVLQALGRLEEARTARARGQKVAHQAGSVKTCMGRAKDWFLGNF